MPTLSKKRQFIKQEAAARGPRPGGGSAQLTEWWQLPWITEGWDGSNGITITGAGVSQWIPIVYRSPFGAGHNFTQGTDSARPTYESGALTFTAASGQFLTAGAFTLNQPTTVFVCYSTTWTSNAYIFDGNTSNTMVLNQTNLASAPDVRIYASAADPVINGVGPADGVLCVHACLFNSSSSLLQRNLGTAVTGDVGTSNAEGLKLGSSGGGVGQYANMVLRGFCYAAAALTQAQINQTVQAMMRRYGVA